MVLRVEIAAVVQLGLIARVEQHRMHAVLVGQREVKDFQLDGHEPAPRIGTYLDRAAIQARATRAVDVDLDPNRLAFARTDRDGEAAQSPPRILRHELHRFPSSRIPWRSSRSRVVYP